MNAYAEGICPLCSRVLPHERLRAHIAGEHARVRENTVQLIQAYHDGWSVEDGVCEACWKSFRDASRALNLLKQVKRHKGQQEPAMLQLNFR